MVLEQLVVQVLVILKLELAGLLDQDPVAQPELETIIGHLSFVQYKLNVDRNLENLVTANDAPHALCLMYIIGLLRCCSVPHVYHRIAPYLICLIDHWLD